MLHIFEICFNCLLSKGIEWGEDDDDDFELEENKEAKSRSEKVGKEQVGKIKGTFNCKYLIKGFFFDLLEISLAISYHLLKCLGHKASNELCGSMVASKLSSQQADTL